MLKARKALSFQNLNRAFRENLKHKSGADNTQRDPLVFGTSSSVAENIKKAKWVKAFFR